MEALERRSNPVNAEEDEDHAEEPVDEDASVHRYRRAFFNMADVGEILPTRDLIRGVYIAFVDAIFLSILSLSLSASLCHVPLPLSLCLSLVYSSARISFRVPVTMSVGMVA